VKSGSSNADVLIIMQHSKLFSQGFRIAQSQYQSIMHHNALHPFISYQLFAKVDKISQV